MESVLQSIGGHFTALQTQYSFVVSIDELDRVASESFPLCMRLMFEKLKVCARSALTLLLMG